MRPLRHLVFLLAAAPLAAADCPNVVLIMSDDMGYSDLGCYGGEIPTPHLDALATGGLRFTQFYNAARCCPTRASLLTGLYPHQAGIGHMVEDLGTPAYQGELNRRSVTIAEVLKPAGYRCYLTGKWHVTPGRPPERMKARTENWPLRRGFDRFYGTIHGSGSFWDPSALVRDDRFVSPADDPEYAPAEYYYTDAISDHAVRFVREHARDHGAQPFFLYVAYTAAHWPMHARESDIARHRGRYDAGYHALRASRWEKQKRLGVVREQWGLSPTAEDFAQVQDPAFERRCMEVYAAMIAVMDEGIGRLVAELKAQGRFDNTLILYLQDNGGCAETNGRLGTGQPRAAQPSLPPLERSALQMVSRPPQTRDGWPVRQGYGVLPGAADTYIAYGRGWANVSNTPFREYKHWVHEGGISTPLIAHWPAGMKAGSGGGREAGSLVHEPAHLIDLMATCVDLGGAEYPMTFGGQAITPREGRSLKPLFTAPAQPLAASPRPLFWEHEGNKALRLGQWKLVAKHKQPWELYDLEADRTEQRNLAAAQPERLRAMAAQWQSWADRVGVVSWTHDIPEGSGASPKGKEKKAAAR
ncbi:MAG: arylsulfatase [Verrucomicrobia bacterium]|nr:arylsulfatase [Verrucomicrobiota bacterium]